MAKNEVRKLIHFGNSSYVISLPKEWIDKNKLGKGDLVYLTKNENDNLVVQPHEKNQEKVEKETTISADGKNMEKLRREIIAAYLNNYSTVKLIGKEIGSKLRAIKTIIRNLIAMEIVNQTRTEVTAKVFLDPETINFKEITTKIDVMVRSLFHDMIQMIRDGDFSEREMEEIITRDEELNSLFFLSHKILKERLENPFLVKNSKLTEIFESWHTNFNLEFVGDRIKEIAEVLQRSKMLKDPKIKKQILDIFTELEKTYLQVMKARHSNDVKLALQLGTRKDEIKKRCKLLSEKYWDKKRVPEICEQLKNIARGTHAIARRIYS
ncbi:MAG: phosphate uptake regulator PhoU [Candidatus Pacearchaeota archaeon]